jgi:A/G-specific adenine glycosylase
MTDEFSQRLLAWFDVHGRKTLPWQHDISPYRVWISEIMLQQTQVATVIPYYQRFMDSFPSLEALAAASVDDVLAHWSGLGYYARGRNIHKAAKQIEALHGGEFPSEIDHVIELPGIGPSTAGAILSIALQQRHAILDGNVKRVLTRHGAIQGHPALSAVNKQLWSRAEEYTPELRVGDYTQAIMDLGATLCTRSRPQCERCPVAADCKGLRSGEPTAFPTRKTKTKSYRWKEAFMPLVIAGNRVYVEKRPPSGIWGGLWSLPQFEGTEELDDWLSSWGVLAKDGERQPEIKHQFSHFGLKITPITFRLSAENAVSQGTIADGETTRWLTIPPAEDHGVLDQFGLAAPVKQILIGNINGSHS